MADDLASFALGCLAAQPTVQFATEGAAIITRAVCPPSPPVDVGALIAEIARLQANNARLQHELAWYENDNARLQENVDKLQAWGNHLYAELVSIKGR